MPIKSNYKNMIPTTIYLTEKQIKKLKKKKEKTGVTFAWLVREAIDRYFGGKR